jgi:hypothetical protein
MESEHATQSSNVNKTQNITSNDRQTTIENSSSSTNPASNESPPYPPYNLQHVTSYTDEQILYYIRTNQISDRQAFLQAKRERDEFLRQVGITVGHDSESAYVPAAIPVSTSPDMVEWTLDDDGEPDMEFPQPVPGEKGVKIERLTTLRHDGGLVNYQNWLSDVNRAFKADPARFNAAVKRIVFATSWFDSKMKSIWVGESKKRPHLEDHWLKFLRWLDKTHLHGESDLIYQLNLYQEAVQGPNEEPTAFYSRLTTLSYGAQTSIGHKDFLARLTPSLKADLAMVHRTGSTLDELLANAQEVWAAQRLRRKSAIGSTRPTPTIVSPNRTGYSNQNRVPGYRPIQRNFNNNLPNTSKPSTSSQRTFTSSRGSHPVSSPISSKLSDEERQRRTENNLCFNCGLSGHFKTSCTRPFRPNSNHITQPTGSSFPVRNQNTIVSRNGSQFRGNQYRRGMKRHVPVRSQPITTTDDNRIQEVDSDDNTKPFKRTKN